MGSVKSATFMPVIIIVEWLGFAPQKIVTQLLNRDWELIGRIAGPVKGIM